MKLDIGKIVHLTCELLPHYLGKCKNSAVFSIVISIKQLIYQTS